MALNKTALKQQIKTAFADQAQKNEDSDAALDDLATKIADAIDAYIKGASIMAAPPQIMAAGLSNAAGPVAAAGNITSTIS